MADSLDHETFLATFKHAPRAAISLLITNNHSEVLLAKRNIEPFKDSWHLPGSFILKGEEISTTIKRILDKEVGIKYVPDKPKLLGVFDDINKDPRGHIIDIIYGFELPERLEPKKTEETKELGFFATLPENIGFNHGDTLKKLGY